MLLEFRFQNYRSFREEAVLSMEATGLSSLNTCLISWNKNKGRLLPAAAIFGKNAGGKSNVIRAFWLAVQFIRNAQRTQYAGASIPVRPFRLDDYSFKDPTTFTFVFVMSDKEHRWQKYWYSFSATEHEIVQESLYHSPKGQKALVFSREGQTFKFTSKKATRKLIGDVVAKNQLFFSIASTMNDVDCIQAMRWFRSQITFSRDYPDIPQQLLAYAENPDMLRAINRYAKVADLGISDMKFEVNHKKFAETALPDTLPEDVKTALSQFLQALRSNLSDKEAQLLLREVRATSFHPGILKDGTSDLFPLGLDDESDGTRQLMALAPDIEKALLTGGLLLIDEIDTALHPLLVQYILANFQSKQSNPLGAQLIFTTHDTELLSMELLRKDQLYFVDKDRNSGISELYSISDLGTRTNENVRKSYLLGKYGAIPSLTPQEVE